MLNLFDVSYRFLILVLGIRKIEQKRKVHRDTVILSAEGQSFCEIATYMCRICSLVLEFHSRSVLLLSDR